MVKSFIPTLGIGKCLSISSCLYFSPISLLDTSAIWLALPMSYKIVPTICFIA